MLAATKNYALLQDEVASLRRAQTHFEPMSKELRGEHDKSLSQIKVHIQNLSCSLPIIYLESGKYIEKS